MDQQQQNHRLRMGNNRSHRQGRDVKIILLAKSSPSILLLLKAQNLFDSCLLNQQVSAFQHLRNSNIYLHVSQLNCIKAA